jgi:two-component system, response regulator PdtaR
MIPARALVADDDPIVRMDVRAALESAGLSVCGEARDGGEVVALALERRPDVVVLDAAMPVADGLEAARRILAALDVPIVMLTGYSYGDLISRALDAGVAAYVVKPFSEPDLLAAVAAVLRGGHTPGTLAYLRHERD